MDLVDLLSVATKGQLFQFNGALYEQTDGVAMGSPLAPLLANVFMSHIKENLEREGKLSIEDMLTIRSPSCPIQKQHLTSWTRLTKLIFP